MFDFSQFVSFLGQTAQKRLFDSKLRLILRKTVQGYSNSVRALRAEKRSPKRFLSVSVQ